MLTPLLVLACAALRQEPASASFVEEASLAEDGAALNPSKLLVSMAALLFASRAEGISVPSGRGVQSSRPTAEARDLSDVWREMNQFPANLPPVSAGMAGHRLGELLMKQRAEKAKAAVQAEPEAEAEAEATQCAGLDADEAYYCLLRLRGGAALPGWVTNALEGGRSEAERAAQAKVEQAKRLDNVLSAGPPGVSDPELVAHGRMAYWAASNPHLAHLTPRELGRLGAELQDLIRRDAARASEKAERSHSARVTRAATADVRGWAGEKAAAMLAAHDYATLRQDPVFGPFVKAAERLGREALSAEENPRDRVPKLLGRAAQAAAVSPLGSLTNLPGQQRFAELAVAESLELMAQEYSRDFVDAAQGALRSFDAHAAALRDAAEARAQKEAIDSTQNIGTAHLAFPPAPVPLYGPIG